MISVSARATPKRYLAYVMWSELSRPYRPGDFFIEALKNEWAYEKRSDKKRTHMTLEDLLCVLVLTHDEMGFAKVAWRYNVLTTRPIMVNGTPQEVPATPTIDGFDPQFFDGPTSEGLLPKLGVRWDGEYLHPALAPGGRHAPPLFDFEQVLVPQEKT